MKAELLFRKKEAIDGYTREMIVWRVQKPVKGCRHLFKYRLYFGLEDGTCLVRYDNERGKGDHKHIEGSECPYLFRSMEGVLVDFTEDSNAVRQKREAAP